MTMEDDNLTPQQRYYRRNLEARRAHQRENYYKNREVMKEYTRNYYREHKELYAQLASTRHKAIRAEHSAWLNEYKGYFGCEVCGDKRPQCLDFHHRVGEQKLYNISQIILRSLQLIEDEIAKCSVMCRNCHRTLHWGANEYEEIPLPPPSDPKYDHICKTNHRIKRRRMYMELKATPCVFCGEDRPECLDFHHRDPSTKEFTISMSTYVKWERMLAEVAKCDLVCANCHQLFHMGVLEVSIVTDRIVA